MQIGRRIFYSPTTGTVIQDTGEREGDVMETIIEQDIEAFSITDGYEVLELPFGKLQEQFMTCYKYSVNPDTKEVIFDFNFPPEPEPEPTELEQLQDYALELEYQLALRELENGGAE